MPSRAHPAARRRRPRGRACRRRSRPLTPTSCGSRNPAREELAGARARRDAVAVVSRDEAWPLRAALLVRHVDADVPIMATNFDPATGASSSSDRRHRDRLAGRHRRSDAGGPVPRRRPRGACWTAAPDRHALRDGRSSARCRGPARAAGARSRPRSCAVRPQRRAACSSARSGCCSSSSGRRRRRAGARPGAVDAFYGASRRS